MMVRFQLSLVALFGLVQIAQAAPDEVAELYFRIAIRTSSASLVDNLVDTTQFLKDLENDRKIDLVIRLAGCVEGSAKDAASNALFNADFRLHQAQQKLDLSKTNSTQAMQLMGEADTAFQLLDLPLARSKMNAAIPKIDAAHDAINEALPLYELAKGDLDIAEAFIELCEQFVLLFPEA